jgi:hypothetical protein
MSAVTVRAHAYWELVAKVACHNKREGRVGSEVS